MVEHFASDHTETERASAPAEERERSTIAFPYGDLDDAITVARHLLDDGGGRGDFDSLAAWMKHESSKSGTYRQKVYTARDFDLIEIEKQTLSITPLGRRILDPQTTIVAKADAFLAVPLYSKIFDTYSGGLLPKDVGLEKQMEDFGVARKQTARARQAFARSAEQAGFFKYGSDRLVRPVAATPTADLNSGSQVKLEDEKPAGGGDDGGDGSVKVVQLTSGGKITLSLSVDLMRLSRDDRTFVFGLIDQLSDYEEKAKPRQLTTGLVSNAPSAVEQDTV